MKRRGMYEIDGVFQIAKRRKRGLICWGVLVLCVVLGLTGCRGGEKGRPKNESATHPPTAAANSGQDPAKQGEKDSQGEENGTSGKEKHQILWGHVYPGGFHISAQRVAQLNRVLEEKGYGWELVPQIGLYTGGTPTKTNPPSTWYLDFLKEAKAQGRKLDVISFQMATPTEVSPLEMIEAGLIEPLDEYLQSPQGKKLFDSFPLEIWEASAVNGHYYNVPGASGQSYFPSCFYVVNRELAEKYNLQVQQWGLDFWSHGEEIKKVWEGEKDPLLHPVKGGFLLTYNFPGWTPLYGTAFKGRPYALNEKTGKVENIYEDPEYQKMRQFFGWLDAQGMIPSSAQENPQEKALICLRSSFNMGELEEEKWIPVGKDPWVYRCDAFYGYAIPSFCENKQEAFDFLCQLYTDPALNTIVAKGDKDSDSPVWIGNPFTVEEGMSSYYPKGFTLEKAKTYYKEWKKSKAFGFTFDPTKVYGQMRAINDYQVEKLYHNAPPMHEFDLEEQNAQLKKLGIDEVIAEMNRQLEEFYRQQR